MAHRAEIDLVLICNQKGRTREPGHGGGEISSEFLSAAEMSEVLGCLRESRFAVTAVVDEDEFMREHARLTRGRGERLPLVMNFASARLGPWGKTVVPALADAAGCKTTNSDAYAMALVRHKFHLSAVVERLGVQVPACWCFDSGNGWLGSGAPPDGIEVLIQPAFESASIGLDAHSLVRAGPDLSKTVSEVARRYQQAVVVREFVAGAEVEVPVITEGAALPMSPVGISVDGAMSLGKRYLTYAEVYGDDYSFFAYDDWAGEGAATELRELAHRVSRGMLMRGFSRVDFRVTECGRPFVIDLSATPHFVHHSSFAYAAELAGMDSRQLPLALVGLALAEP
ncbi:MAG: hypothetical protein AAF533_16500 [Acidobacteriota bacterium]